MLDEEVVVVTHVHEDSGLPLLRVSSTAYGQLPSNRIVADPVVNRRDIGRSQYAAHLRGPAGVGNAKRINVQTQQMDAGRRSSGSVSVIG